MTSPTQRTLAEARKLGMTVQVVERWNQFAHVRVDLFSVIDIVAMMPGIGIMGIQACARSSHAARRAKCLHEPKLRTWLESGGRFEVWSWARMGKAGCRKLWQCWREEIRVADMLAESPEPTALTDLPPCGDEDIILP